MSQSTSAANSTPLPLKILASRYFLEWLNQSQVSLALTTYQSSRLMLIGTNEMGQISGFERMFERAMGLFAVDSERLYLSSRYQIWQLDNVLQPGQQYNGFDRLYVPRVGFTTGDLDIHDLTVDRTGRLVFISSLLNCIGTIGVRHSCTPLWKPPFISQLVNEDRCHLNGLAMEAGLPRYVTACSQSDVVDGWRDRRREGGCVIDLQTNEIIAAGLSMPHSPRYYQGRLWLHQSGTGEFGYLDFSTGRFEPIAFCPGYLRGLAFLGNFAIVGLSRPRGDRTFTGLALEEQLIRKQTEACCGVMVIDLQSGNIAHWLKLEGVVTELYDIQVLPGVRQPMALGFQTDEIARLLTLEPIAPLFSSVPFD
ncbi:MAG TPA: TIGR03032 family protein [Trichocoleus sp.]